jgi:hypothetical protein
MLISLLKRINGISEILKTSFTTVVNKNNNIKIESIDTQQLYIHLTIVAKYVHNFLGSDRKRSTRHFNILLA